MEYSNNKRKELKKEIEQWEILLIYFEKERKLRPEKIIQHYLDMSIVDAKAKTKHYREMLDGV